MKWCFTITLVVVAQINLNAQRTHLVELSTSLLEEFDVNKSIQSNTISGLFDFEKEKPPQGTTPRVLVKTPNICGCHYPVIVGLSYSYLNESRNMFLLSFQRYINSRNPFRVDVKTGETLRRKHSSFSLGVGQRLKASATGRFVIYGISGISARVGVDQYYIENLPLFTHYPERRMRDGGVFIGFKIIQFLPWNSFVSVSGGYTRWVFLYANSIQNTRFKLPRNSIEVKFSVGFTFGKGVNPKGVGFKSVND